MNLIFDRAYYFSFARGEHALKYMWNLFDYESTDFNSLISCEGEGIDDVFINIVSHIE